jgi:hypothetical protein
MKFPEIYRKNVVFMRKRDLLSAGLVLLAGAKPGLLAASGNDEPDAAAALVRLLDGHEAMMAAGAAYLRQAPAEAAQEQLLALLTRRKVNSAAELAADVQSRIASEWRRGDAVVIDGWLLARSEARLCALASLTGSYA